MSVGTSMSVGTDMAENMRLRTLAANVNSRSSDRNVLSSIAVSITSLSSSSLWNRYSVTPSHMRKSFSGQHQSQWAMLRVRLTGVEQIM